MQLILTEDVDKLGNAGELVKVKPGYGRNFLLPEGLAVFADDSAIIEYERKRQKIEEAAQVKREAAQANKVILEDVDSITVQARAGSTGKLFGSITKEQIASAILDQAKIEVDKHKIKVKFPINMLGEHHVIVGLAAGIETQLTVKVNSEN